ncbi:alpha/beta hydrolase [Mycolicibacterium madagascariense]|nr:alpha/beta hydrolase-fold protein [Mycolicibacterium madagascariense]MCV7011112.1 esterase family protein [Mycolicibacterium madagascariense]
MHGWLPWTVQIVTAVVLVVAIGWRTRRWRLLWLPIALLAGGALAAGSAWFIDSQGLADDPAPTMLWVWLVVTGAAAVVFVVGWRSAAWWRRAVSAVGVPLCLLCAALAVNLWVGYFPTVDTVWTQVTAGPLPDQTDRTVVTAMQTKHQIPAKGVVVPVDIGSAASGFKHRGEFVYLPPAWFATNPAPHLPTLMMIGGEFNTPADWIRIGNAVTTADDFAAANRGNAPVMVFVDSGGAFNNDTECVNGPRGNAADHLTKDVVPFMEQNFGVSGLRTNWGIVGWSMGGTCALDLATMHPDVFSTFEDIAGDRAPNSGTRQQTIARLFGGNATAYAAFDPASVIAKHGPYQGVYGWFAINGSGLPTATNALAPNGTGLGGQDVADRVGGQSAAAYSLCGLGAADGIACAVMTQPGKHDWPFAERALAAAMPWLAGRIGTPGVPVLALPAPPPVTSRVQ